MGTVRVTGNLIVVDQIEGDESLRNQLQALYPGSTVLLEVGGYTGRWRRTRSGSAECLQPLDLNVGQAWTAMQGDPGRVVQIGLVTPNGAHLVTFGQRHYQHWDDPASQYR